MYFFLLATMVTTSLAVQELPDGEAILKQISERAQGRQSMQYVLEATLKISLEGKPDPKRSGTTKVTVAFVNPGRLRIEEQGVTGARLQVSDGENTWVYEPARKQYTKARAGLRLGTLGLPGDWLNRLPVSELLGNPKTLREESVEVDGERRDCWVITGPLKAPPGFSNAVITSWIDKTSAIAVKHEAVLSVDPPQAAGRSLPPVDVALSVTVRSLSFDESIPNEQFSFIAPADAKEVAFFTNRPEPDRLGRPAANFDAKDLEGKSYSLGSLKGKPVLLDFWATWCRPCVESAPALEKISKDFKDRLIVLAINIGESRRTVDTYLKPNPMHYPVIMGSDFGMDRAFEVSGFPTFILIGADGNVAAHQVGYNGEASLRGMLASVGLVSAPAATSITDVPRPPAPPSYRPSGVGADSLGNVYIADSVGAVVRRVSRDGSAVTIAGTGISGFAGDGGPATAALLGNPTGVALDKDNNLYIADATNAHVRKVTPDGVIRVVSGATQLQRVAGIAVDASGNLYIAEAGAHRVKKVAPDGSSTIVAGTGIPGSRGDGGPAISAQLSSPAAIAVDEAGNLYIADTGNRRIRMVSSDGTITLVAGNGSEGFSGDNGRAVFAQFRNPAAIAVDDNGNVFISDAGNFRIRKVNTEGTITTVAGAGTSGNSVDGESAMEARLGSISSVAVDREGNVYAADTTNGIVLRFTPGGVMSTLAGSQGNTR